MESRKRQARGYEDGEIVQQECSGSDFSCVSLPPSHCIFFSLSVTSRLRFSVQPRAKVPLPALSSCFSACPTPKSARLNLPWNFGALPPAMQRTLPRGRPFVMLFYLSRNKMSVLRAQFCIFSVVNCDQNRAISDLTDSPLIPSYLRFATDD